MFYEQTGVEYRETVSDSTTSPTSGIPRGSRSRIGVRAERVPVHSDNIRRKRKSVTFTVFIIRPRNRETDAETAGNSR